jgi:hypothetical protein
MIHTTILDNVFNNSTTFQTSGISTVEYFVTSVGVYTVSLKWEGQHLVGSPVTVPGVLVE